MLAQLLTAEQGLRAVTLDAAWALGDEARRGHLTPGTLGDVTILSGDVTAATPDEIRAMAVIAIIVGGIPAYCADPVICSRPEGNRSDGIGTACRIPIAPSHGERQAHGDSRYDP